MAAQKKITFSKKPIIRDSDIDKWVSGGDQKPLQSNFKRTTVYLPEETHKKLKMEAAGRGTTMSEIIAGILSKELGV